MAEIFQHIIICYDRFNSHNLGVIEKVAEELEVDTVPKTILCNAHPLLLFQGKQNELFIKEIHDNLGKQKIDNCFLVDVDFRHVNFVQKSLKCLNNFISKDYSALRPQY